MKKLGLLSVLLCISIITSYGQIPATTVPEFSFFTRSNKTFTNTDLPVGKMLFFVFFDPDCDHCQHAMIELNKNFKSFSKTTVCLVSVDSWEKINHFLNAYGPAVHAGKNVILLRDSLNQFITKFQPRRYPAMFLYSAERKIMGYEDTPEAIFRFVWLIDANKLTAK